MRFTLGRVVHFYYVAVLVALTVGLGMGAKHYWETGLLNTEYISNLYDGTSKVQAIKERNDIEEIKKFVDGDRIKEAQRLFARFETDIFDLRSIKNTDQSGLSENTKKIKAGLTAFQNAPELSAILNSISSRVSVFETFVTEKKWPTLTKMAINLRNKTSPGRLMQGGLFSFEKTQNLALSINNDLEAMTNFTQSSGLPADIKAAIINRMQPLKTEVAALDNYVDGHKSFNRSYKEFASSYEAWFKFVEPEIALKKIQFEKSSQTIMFSLIGVFTALVGFMSLGFVIYNYSVKRGSQKSEKMVLDTIKDNILPVEAKDLEKFSPAFRQELDKYRDYVHKRMSFGSIFQEAMPFASILLDSNLNLVWGNSLFYEQWQLQNFNEDGGDSLSWDFLQRFTDLEDNSAILSALRMSSSGVYKIQVKNGSMARPMPYEMHVSPVEYSSQKRIFVLFYPMAELEDILARQKAALSSPLLRAVEAELEEKMTVALKQELRTEADRNGSGDIFSRFNQYVEKSESARDELSREIEKLEQQLSDQRNMISEARKIVVSSFETQRDSVDKFNHFKSTVTAVLEARDQLEEQLKFALSASRDFYKDQNKILTSAQNADRTVDDYVKTLKNITALKSDFKEMKTNVDEFKSRIIQVLDQLLIFQNHEDDTLRVDQFLGKIKLEMKGFEKVLMTFNQVVTQLDVTITKLDMMVESREKTDLEAVRARLDNVKNNLENAQFSASKLSQTAHTKDDELVSVLRALIANLKSEMRRIDDMCRLTGLTSEHLKVISPAAAEGPTV